MLENKEKDIKHSLPILFVSSEATPFAPNGDLAAKVTNLATKIAKQPENHFVAVVIPGYKQYMDEFKGNSNTYTHSNYQPLIARLNVMFYRLISMELLIIY